MGFASYSELKDAVERWLERTDRDTEIQDWIRLIEAEVERRLDLRSQQQSVSGTLSGGTEYIEAPAGLLYPELLVFDVEPPRVVRVLTLGQGEELGFEEVGQATPTHASQWGVSATYQIRIRVWPVPPSDVAYTLYYTSGIQPLTSAAPVNYLLTVAPDLYLYGCKMHGELFDDNAAGAAPWRTLFDKAVLDLKRVQKLSRLKFGRARMSPTARFTP